MNYTIHHIKMIELPFDLADNGDLVVMEAFKHVPFAIARVFVVRGWELAVRGQHAHKACSQFLTCPYGSVDIICKDGDNVVKYNLNHPNVGLLIPPSIWAQQNYLTDNAVLTVLCDRPYEPGDYIRNYDEYIEYRRNNS
jgi:dTDP-4-dehydrorhamnose 3,5-epimerase-like enzyme